MSRPDFAFLTAWLVFPPVILISIHGNFLTSIILYLVMPSIYFSLKRPNIIPRAAAIAGVAMLVGFILDWIAFFNNAWTVPTIFPFKILQSVPIEDFLFIFFAAYVIISGAHYYYPKLSPAGLNIRRLKKSFGGIVLCFLVFLGIQFLRPDVLLVSYYDAWLLVVAFVFPSIFLVAFRPAYFKPLLFIVGFQLVAMLPYELIADAFGFWTFPAPDYLGMIHLLGQEFPVEEFLEWMIFMAPAVLGFNILVGGTRQKFRGIC